VTGASDNRIHIWDVKNGKEEARLLGHTGSVSGLDYQAATGTLISSSFDTSVRIWNPPSTDGKVVEQNLNRTTR
jgi:WD40 repeat protein